MKIKAKIAVDAKRSANKYLYRKIAASVTVILGLFTGVYLYYIKPFNKVKLVNVVTNNTQKHRTTLPDGTLVWLNVNSQLTYFTNYIHHREIWLKGEAYFEVKHNALQPFLVHTKNLSVKDLGTVFNLKAYPGQKTETSLIQGSVEIALNNQQDKKNIVLKPYQKLILESQLSSAASSKFPIVHVETIAFQQENAILETKWIHEEFSFSNERFEDILPALEKHFGLTINIENPNIKEYRFTGTFKDASFTTILNALQFSNEFKYRKEGDKTIIIY